MHTCIISFITIFGVGLQLKFPNVSPYETAYGTLMMNLFIIEICFYLASLVVMAIQAASNNRVLEDLTNKDWPLAWNSVPDFRVARSYFTLWMDRTVLLEHLPSMLPE